MIGAYGDQKELNDTTASWDSYVAFYIIERNAGNGR